MNITIVPETDEATGLTEFRARAGAQEATGATIGGALDALTARLSESDDELSGTLILLQKFQPDRYFTAAQRDRLAELMGQWRAARDSGSSLPDAEQHELESLVRAEVIGMGERARALLHDTSK